MPTFPFSEKYLSQIPALQQLINLGYQYFPPTQAMTERSGRTSNVLLENILRDQLKKINRIRYKGGEYLFSEENIQSAIQKLKTVQYDGLQKTNEAIYDLITLGTALEQTIEGDSKSFTLNYIDWKNPANNAFHAVAEFSVERARSTETARPDIVLFVNGIPLVVIECKAPDTDAEQAVSQMIRNQGDEYIPRLFTYAQILLAVNKNEAKYATVGTSKEFWSVWDELEDAEREVNACINKALSSGDKDTLFSGEFASARSHFDALEHSDDRLVTEQDRCLYSLCRPERLLELIFGFIVFESGSKKICPLPAVLSGPCGHEARQTKRQRRSPHGRYRLAHPRFREVHYHGHADPCPILGARPNQPANDPSYRPQRSRQTTRAIPSQPVA